MPSLIRGGRGDAEGSGTEGKQKVSNEGKMKKRVFSSFRLQILSPKLLKFSFLIAHPTIASSRFLLASTNGTGF